MTALVGSSLALLPLSALALVLGWAGASEVLIWASIAASSASFVLLAVAYARSRTGAAPRRRDDDRAAPATR